MTKFSFGAGVAAAVALVLPAVALAGESPDQAYLRGEASLIRELNGRVPGQPVPCITRRLVVETRVIDRTAILFRMPDGTMFVNRPAKGTQLLPREGVVGEIGATPRALCQNDFVAVHEPGGRAVHIRGTKGLHLPGASAQLGAFVPYFER
ncbi:hypothetical protein [Caulobacter vibrioides]|uniref:hypothetical protein n=1 Tax=Caulobacter vibrioides TaxID=155892 RepID=UPI000BB4ED8E|nr:hypothetical protein [Caulobacter vibrioides]ATC23821.1 hypothetical protein CA608_04370 [Caulobacter vibrioides]PLR15969.1 hypothetical protein CVUC_02435 [Caulobacter vibrioides]